MCMVGEAYFPRLSHGMKKLYQLYVTDMFDASVQIVSALKWDRMI